MWTTLAPLIGVLLGGLMSMPAQRSAGRALERGEARRSVRELAEARRNERLTHLIAFLSAVQEAERVAVDRYHHNLADEQWQARARQVLDRGVGDAEDDEKVWAHIHPSRQAFLDLVRDQLS